MTTNRPADGGHPAIEHAFKPHWPQIRFGTPLATRLANRKAGKPWRNEQWPTYCAQSDDPGFYYVEPGALRLVGWCDDIASRSIRHRGWFTDREYQADVMRGIVFALPADNGRRRLVAGYHWNGGDSEGATVDFGTVYDDELEAAHAADELARVAADHECDYQEQERERMRLEEEEDARLENLAECHPPLWVTA